MRDCIFLVADTNMEAAFKGFLERDQFYQSLQCGAFEFNAKQDLIVASGDNDPGLYTRAHEILRSYTQTHSHAIVVLDAEWEGSPGAEQITKHITNNLSQSGWDTEMLKVIVIDPELENWIWQKNLHVATALGMNSVQDITTDLWPEGQTKPERPKETLEAVLKRNRIPRSSAIYNKITSHVSVGHCQDASFQLLKSTLQAWFPMGGYSS